MSPLSSSPAQNDNASGRQREYPKGVGLYAVAPGARPSRELMWQKQQEQVRQDVQLGVHACAPGVIGSGAELWKPLP